jgi:alkanesulfonate monooxygenase SsuD/methylene tetrahydromethanopterin reductase-like flavin-dependent oxidoreductase (luciferase family)
LWVAAQSGTGLFNAGRDGLNLLTASNSNAFFGPVDELEEALKYYDAGLAESGAKRGRILINRAAWIDDNLDAAMAHIDEVYHNWTYYSAGAPEKPNVRGEELFLPRDDPRSGWKRKDRPIQGGRIQTETVPPLDLSAKPERYDGPIITDPAGAIEQFKKYESLGVTDINLMMQFGAPIDQLVHSLEVISREVMPAFAARKVTA